MHESGEAYAPIISDETIDKTKPVKKRSKKEKTQKLEKRCQKGHLLSDSESEDTCKKCLTDTPVVEPKKSDFVDWIKKQYSDAAVQKRVIDGSPMIHSVIGPPVSGVLAGYLRANGVDPKSVIVQSATSEGSKLINSCDFSAVQVSRFIAAVIPGTELLSSEIAGHFFIMGLVIASTIGATKMQNLPTLDDPKLINISGKEDFSDSLLIKYAKGE